MLHLTTVVLQVKVHFVPVPARLARSRSTVDAAPVLVALDGAVVGDHEDVGVVVTRGSAVTVHPPACRGEFDALAAVAPAPRLVAAEVEVLLAGGSDEVGH